MQYDLNILVRDIVREEIARNYVADEPELIDIAATAELCDNVDRSVIDSLVQNAAINGFPCVRLSNRIVKIDKRRLVRWLAAGGLGVKE